MRFLKYSITTCWVFGVWKLILNVYCDHIVVKISLQLKLKSTFIIGYLLKSIMLTLVNMSVKDKDEKDKDEKETDEGGVLGGSKNEGEKIKMKKIKIRKMTLMTKMI